MAGVLPWKLIGSVRRFSDRVFDLRSDMAQSSMTGREHEFHVLEAGPWVNVIPLTPNERVVLIRQFRHGIRDMTLEIPGGMVEHGMSPLQAGKQELIEETGCTAERWTDLGWVHPNPAILTNRCHTFLARDLACDESQELDETEEIEILNVPLDEIPTLIREGKITHALVVVAFYRLFVEIGFKGGSDALA